MRHSLRRIVAVGCLLLPLWIALVAPAFAQEDTSEDRATSFQAVEGPPKEDVPGGPLLVGAYAFVLVLLIGYAARLGALQSRTARELERLTRTLEARGKGE
jgi:hypothetical protein